MKKIFYTLPLLIISVIILANLSACVINNTKNEPNRPTSGPEDRPQETPKEDDEIPPTDDSENQPEEDDSVNGTTPEETPKDEEVTPDENMYFPVKFESGVDGVTIPDKFIKYGMTVPEPQLDPRDGYELLGWRKINSDDFYSFDTPVTEILTLKAVWREGASGLIYDSKTKLQVVYGDDENDFTFASSIKDALSEKLPLGITLSSTVSTESYHEIVIGKTERKISEKAYAELEKLTGGEKSVAYLIYSDGRSLALAYTDTEDSIAIEALENIFLKNYIKSDLTVAAGIDESYCLTIEDFVKQYDDDKKATEWERLEKILSEDIGEEAAAEFISALRDLYSLYTPNVVDWFAKLYDPEIGGYYYSNSARDNEKVKYPATSSSGVYYDLLPDIESTNQALGFFTSSRMLRTYSGENLPLFMREQIVKFVLSCQDPNGYFYHPQWPKSMTDSKTSRRSRDLSWATNILSSFGAKPLYTTPNGVQGTIKSASALTMSFGRSSTSAVSCVLAAASVSSNPNLQNKTTFEAYLASLDIENRSYHVGNELTSQTSEILARDTQLKSEGADYSLMNILISWLNEHQKSETGHWHSISNYYGVNGLLKISGIYNSARQPIPNARAAAQSAIDAITSNETMGAVVDLYNTWFALGNVLKNVRSYGTAEDQIYVNELLRDLRTSAPAAILKSKEKISAFQKADGSFSYGPKYSSSTSQGMPVALYEKNEGDINATVISIGGIYGNIMSALELSAFTPSLFGETEFRRYIGIIDPNYDLPLTEPARMKLQEIMSNSTDSEEAKKPLNLLGYEVLNFNNGLVPSRVTSNLMSNGASLSVEMQALVYKTTSGANDSLYITAVKKQEANVSVFNADLKVTNASYNSTLYQMMFDSSSGKRAYMFVVGYEYGYITLYDMSSNGDGMTRKVNTIKLDQSASINFNLGIEYYSLENGEVRIKIFIDGDLVFVSDNFYNCHKDGTLPQCDLAKVNFYTLNAASATLTLDNIRFAQDSVEYKDLSVGAK